jgi:hypothetical protein
MASNTWLLHKPTTHLSPPCPLPLALREQRCSTPGRCVHAHVSLPPSTLHAFLSLITSSSCCTCRTSTAMRMQCDQGQNPGLVRGRGHPGTHPCMFTFAFHTDTCAHILTLNFKSIPLCCSELGRVSQTSSFGLVYSPFGNPGLVVCSWTAVTCATSSGCNTSTPS